MYLSLFSHGSASGVFRRARLWIDLSRGAFIGNGSVSLPSLADKGWDADEDELGPGACSASESYSGPCASSSDLIDSLCDALGMDSSLPWILPFCVLADVKFWFQVRILQRHAGRGICFTCFQFDACCFIQRADKEAFETRCGWILFSQFHALCSFVYRCLVCWPCRPHFAAPSSQVWFRCFFCGDGRVACQLFIRSTRKGRLK